MSTIIRHATIGDYEALCALWEEGDALHRAALPHVFRLLDAAPTRELVQSMIDDPEGAILVAVAAGNIVGLLTLADEMAPPHRLKQERR